MASPLQQLTDHGQSPWLDYVAREFTRSGKLEDLVGRGIVGVTSNPTIFQAAIAEGDAYDDQLREVMREQDDPKEVFLALALTDIREACDVLAPVFERGASTRDGWVSLEVDPNLAMDAAGDARGGQAPARRGRQAATCSSRSPAPSRGSRRSRRRSPPGSRST